MQNLSSLYLNNFRNYGVAKYVFDAPVTVITGRNGIGKTNLLEAISLLTPGKGLRSAELTEFLKSGANEWAINAEIAGYEIATGAEKSARKRTVKIDGENQKGTNALAGYVSCVWLTPQMDGVFLADKGERRKFFDRIIYNFDPEHAGRVSVYENAMRERLRLLKQGSADGIWLKTLEKRMAEYGVAIAAARVEVVGYLQAEINAAPTSFLKPVIGMNGKFEHLITQKSARDVEEEFATELLKARQTDAMQGRSSVGVHRTDFVITNPAKEMPAYMCSTGEQKALLVSVILALARMLVTRKNRRPMLLLDEVAAHLDEGRRIELYNEIKVLGCQTFLTGTEPEIFTACAAAGLHL